MKKLTALLLTLFCILTFTGCYDKEYDYQSDSQTENQISESNDKDTAYAENDPIIDKIINEQTESEPEDTINNESENTEPVIDTTDKTKTSTGIPFDELEKCQVKRVVDGDTFTIVSDNKEIKVRLIGIDTPESVASQEYLDKTGKENTQEGIDASTFTKELISDKTVYLEFDAGREDKYGRLLAYVYLEDGRMLQDILLENGYAELMTIQPNVKYADRFVQTIQSSRDE